MDIKKIKAFRFFDAVVIIGVLALAVLLLVFGNIGGEGEYFTVKCNGKETVYRLDKAQNIEISSNGVTLNIACDGKSVRVKGSNCPDKCCVNTGEISRSNQMIVCAPARLSVRVNGEGEGYDAFTN